MTANETPAALLRRAADRLDEMAETTTPGHWEACEHYPDDWAVRATRDTAPWLSLYVALETGQGYAVAKGDAHWIAALSPKVAAPLSLWLRSTADDAQMVDDANEAARARAARTGGDGHTFLIQDPYVAHAVALARSILGEAETA